MKSLPAMIFLSMTMVNAPLPHKPLMVPAVDAQLLNWLKSNVSPVTQLPYSFYIPSTEKESVFKRMAGSDPVEGVIERTIAEQGLDIYDGAVYQIVLSMIGGLENLQQAFLPLQYYWEGSVGDTFNIRAGYPINLFVYNTKNPEAVSSDMNRYGERGFIFRIINADGNFLVSDPLDGKKTLPGFPDEDRLHWVDWKPVAGENAWVVMAAMQLYHKKYFSSQTQHYHHNLDSIELRLSKEIARAAIMLQSECGGIRMAPLGVHRTLDKGEERHFDDKNWWYNHISTENNISWYAAFRMLYQITGDAIYLQAMQGIEQYLYFVWDAQSGLFHQGAYFIDGEWNVSREHFALDVQTWGIVCLGVKTLDAWFGFGSGYRMWQTSKNNSGVYDSALNIVGVGYTTEHDRVSVEWTAGALMALDDIVLAYANENPSWSRDAQADKESMRASINVLYRQLPGEQAAFSYSSKRGSIPFGWNSHDPEVMSLASTGWMMFVDAKFNPFFLNN